MDLSSPALAPVVRETTSPSMLLDPIAMQGTETLLPAGRRPAQVSPLPWLACAFAAGIALVELLAPPPGTPHALLWLAAALLALALELTARRGHTRRVAALALALAALVGAALAAHARTAQEAGELRVAREAFVVARLEGAVRVGPGGRAAEARIERVGYLDAGDEDTRGTAAPPLLAPVSLRVWLVLPHGGPLLANGDRIAARVVLRGARRPLAPGGFDERDLMRQRALAGVAAVRGEPVALEAAWSPAGALDRHRQRAGRLLGEHGAPSGMLPALALGQGSTVDPGAREVFGRSGLAHVLAVSGLHFGLVAVAVFALVRALARRIAPLARRVGAERVAALVALPVLAAYVVYVGAPVSARRAFIMAACLLGGRVLGREGHPQLSLSLAALIILALRPAELTAAGFQLSFAAVLGLLWTSACWEKPGTRWLTARLERRWLRGPVVWLWSALASTAGASLATTPFVLWHFGQVPLVGGVANLWVIPAVSFLLLPAALGATLLCDVWHGGAVALAQAGGWLETRLLESVVAFDAGAPAIAVELVAQPPLVVVGYGVGAVALLLAPHWPRRGWPVALAAAAALGLWHAGLDEVARRRPGELAVTFVSIGQGDATLIEFPDGRAMLIDGGGVPASSYDPGARVVLPFLRRLGRARLDWVVLTHPDFDHMGGLASVVRATRPREVWTNGDVLRSAPYEALTAAIEEVGARHRVIDASAPPLEIGGARLQVVWPDRLEPGRERNDNSIVLRLEHGALSFLLPGDAETAAEAGMLASGARLDATVLKAGHHGSRSSSTEAFLEAVAPRWLVYSVGEDNGFGFPHAEVVERARRRGIAELRTDVHGTVRMRSDGQRLWVETWRP